MKLKKQKKQIKTVLWDADGVIFVTEHLQYKSWLPFLKPYGIDISKKEYVDEFVGNNGSTIAKNIIKKYGLSMKPETLLEMKESLLVNWFEEKEPELFFYAREALEYTKNHFQKMAIVTGAPLDEARLKFERSGLGDIVDDLSIISRSHSEVINGKPAPDSYLVGMKETDSKSGTTMVIEDTPAGIQSAMNAGIKTVFAVPHDFVNRLYYPKGTIIMPNLEEVVKYAKENFK